MYQWMYHPRRMMLILLASALFMENMDYHVTC